MRTCAISRFRMFGALPRRRCFISGEINSEAGDPAAKMAEIAERYSDVSRRGWRGSNYLQTPTPFAVGRVDRLGLASIIVNWCLICIGLSEYQVSMGYSETIYIVARQGMS
jgi:hypothetical protein